MKINQRDPNQEFSENLAWDFHLGAVAQELSLGIFRLEISSGLSYLTFRLGILVCELWFQMFLLGTFIWNLSFLRLGILALKLYLGAFAWRPSLWIFLLEHVPWEI